MSGCAGTSGILPFGFGGQPIAAMFPAAEPATELHCIEPTDSRSQCTFRAVAGRRLVVKSKLAKLSRRDFRVGHIEFMGNPNLMYGFLVVITIHKEFQLSERARVRATGFPSETCPPGIRTIEIPTELTRADLSAGVAETANHSGVAEPSKHTTPDRLPL